MATKTTDGPHESGNTLHEQSSILWNLAKKSQESIALMFVDVVGSTWLSTRQVEEFFQQDYLLMVGCHLLAKSTDRLSVVKTIGDEVMMSTGQIDESNTEEVLTECLRLATSIQIDMAKHKVPVKVGLHLCREVIPLDILKKLEWSETRGLVLSTGDVLGADVNLAARVMSVAKPHQILITRSVLEALPDGLQNAARMGQAVAVADQLNVEFSQPVYFRFKGFEGSPKSYVIQVTCEETKAHVSREFRDADMNPQAIPDIRDSGFYTLLMVDPKNRKPRDITRCIGEAEKLFWPGIERIFEKTGKRTEICGDEDNALPYGFLIRADSYEDYSDKLSAFKKRLSAIGMPRCVTRSIHFWKFDHESWRATLTKPQNPKGILYLLKTEYYGVSEELKDKLRIQTLDRDQSMDLNQVVTGYYDNVALFSGNIAVNCEEFLQNLSDGASGGRRGQSDITELIDDDDGISAWPVEISVPDLPDPWSYDAHEYGLAVSQGRKADRGK